jgi:hypothetical protein
MKWEQHGTETRPAVTLCNDANKKSAPTSFAAFSESLLAAKIWKKNIFEHF